MTDKMDLKEKYAVVMSDYGDDRIFLFDRESDKNECIHRYAQVAEMLFEAAPEEFSTYADVFQYVKDFLEQKDKQ